MKLPVQRWLENGLVCSLFGSSVIAIREYKDCMRRPSMKHSIPRFQLGLALVLASLLGQAFADSSPLPVAGSSWQALTTMAPAVAVSKTTKYIAWVGQTDNKIWFSAYDGTSWTKQQVVEGTGWTALTSSPPALAWDFVQDELWLAWKGNGSNTEIWYSTWDGTSWSKQQVVAGTSPVWTAGTSAAPVLAFANDKIYLAWKGESGNDIWYTNWKYPGWTQQATVDGSDWTAETSTAPGMDGGISGPVMFWKGTGTHLWASSGASWSVEQEVSCASPSYTANTDQSPAGVELLNGLETIPVIDVVFWKNSSDNSIWYSDTLGPSGLCTFSVPATVSGKGWSASTTTAPAVASAQVWSSSMGTILAWKNAADNTIWFMDPTTLPGVLGY